MCYKAISTKDPVVVVKKITELNKDQISSLTIQGKQGKSSLTFRLRNMGGTWVLPDKYNFPVEQKRAHQLLNSFLSMRLSKPVATSIASQSRLFVSERMYARKITWPNGNNLEGFYLGSPAGKANMLSHIRLLGENEVYQGVIMNSWQVGLSTRDWISPIFLDLDVDDVVEFRQVQKNNSYGKDELYVRRVNGHWILQGMPSVTQEPFNPVSFSSYLSMQCFWDLDDIAGKGVPFPPNSNLSDAPIVMTFTIRDKKTGKTRDVKVYVGYKQAGGEGYYCRTSEEPWIYIISPEKAYSFALKREFFGDEYRKNRDPNSK